MRSRQGAAVGRREHAAGCAELAQLNSTGFGQAADLAVSQAVVDETEKFAGDRERASAVPRRWAMRWKGVVALRSAAARVRHSVAFSNSALYLGESGPDLSVGWRVHAELVVASAHYLHEGVPGEDHPG
jgi:hypothetical protein